MKTERLFTCSVLPGTRAGTLFRPTCIALLVAGVLTLCLWPILRYGRLVGLLVFAVLLAVWYRCRSKRNPMLEFIHEWHTRQGYTTSRTVTLDIYPRWLPFAVGAVLVVVPWPVIASMTASLLVLLVAWNSAGRDRTRLRWVWSTFCEWMFVFHRYPDTRFTAPGGTGGLWLPHDRRESRARTTATELLPASVGLTFAAFYVVLDAHEPVHDRSSPVWLLAHVAATLVAVALPVLSLAAIQIRPIHEYSGALNSPTALGASDWEHAANLVAHSKHVADGVALSEHLFIGWHLPSCDTAWHPLKLVSRWELPCKTPALLAYSILKGNAHFLGSTGSRKTSLGVMTLLTQIIRGHNELVRDRAGQPLLGSDAAALWRWSEPVPLLIIDLKGDLAFFHTCRLEAERRGQRFHYFSLSQGHATAYFNPITNLGIGERPVVEWVELVINALSLFHGLSYGKGYYSKQHRDLLLTTIKNAPRKPQTWEELHELLLTELNPKKHRDVFELVSSIYVLAQFTVLGKAPASVDEIYMPSVIANREVVFCSLPVRLSAMSARDVAKLLLFSFVTAAGDWNDTHPERRSYIALDEAQVICSSNMGTLFQQCSGAKTSMFLSNQARSDLNVPDAPTLGDTVRVNTHFKQMFTVVDPRDGRELIEVSGERLGYLRSYSTQTSSSGTSSGVTETEVLCPSLTQNDINFVNEDAQGSLVQVITGAGFTRLNGVPRHVWTPYSMSSEEYERRMHTPWPTLPERNVTVPAAPRTVVNKEDVEDVQSRAEDNYARLMQFFKQTALRAGRHRMSDWQD
ncbi:MAG: hypothetical protein FLDDKLPJ_03340 [Phycisphaerae bacterium]|nr:hypothetical protein [Phycisphaerae bacterium]